MNQNQEKQKNEPGLDVNVEAAWKRLLDNNDDDIENTFCYQLFELNYFSEDRFFELCKDMELVILGGRSDLSKYKILIWIISCIFRCVFSHLDKKDLYKISNFDMEISEKWRDEYLERLRYFLDEISSIGFVK